MALTPGGTPYVESSDLVANYPAVSLALAEHIDDLPAAILQVVRATDVTARSTTSQSFVDITGMSVTITPKKIDSKIMVLSLVTFEISAPVTTDSVAALTITDSANTSLSGAENNFYGVEGVTRTGTLRPYHSATALGWVVPATLSAVTYKLRGKVYGPSRTLNILNNSSTGQMIAIEVSA